MVSKEILTVLCGLGLSLTAAVAEPAPPPPVPMAHGAPGVQMSPAEMQKMHARMCLAGYAREVGQLSGLKVRLELKDSQEAAFSSWKNVKLKLAAARKADCLAMKMPEMPAKPDMKAGMKPGAGPHAMAPKPDMVKGLEMEQTRLVARLKEIKAEMPALKKLMAVLSEDQKAAFMPPMDGHKGGPKGGPDAHCPMGGPGPHGGPDGGPHGPDMPPEGH